MGVRELLKLPQGGRIYQIGEIPPLPPQSHKKIGKDLNFSVYLGSRGNNQTKTTNLFLEEISDMGLFWSKGENPTTSNSGLFFRLSKKLDLYVSISCTQKKKKSLCFLSSP